MSEILPSLPQRRSKPGTEWTADLVRQWFQQRARPTSEERTRLGCHHRAASVLASFDARQLRTPMVGDLTTGGQSRLLKDSVPIPAAGSASEGHATRWSLKPSVRRDALASFPDAATLRAALQWNERPSSDAFQQALDTYILGTAAPPASQTIDQLTWSVQVVGWLSTAPFAAHLALPDLEEVRRRLDFARLLAPLQRMADARFRGRASEQQRLHDYLFADAAPDIAPKPLVIYGFGGSGKTALLSKVLVDYVEGRLEDRQGKLVAHGPCVYLDFDRPSIVPEEPTTLLLEAVRQISAQSRETHPRAQTLVTALEEMLRSRGTERSLEGLNLGRLLTGNVAANMFNDFADLLQTPEWRQGGIPLLFVLDTFEQVQYHGQKVVEHVWTFLGELRERVPQVRIIVAGRAPLEMEIPVSDSRELGELDEESAMVCLGDDGVPAETARYLYEHVGGSPLALRLAGGLARKESEAGFREFISTEFTERLDDELAQAILYRRFLGQIKSGDVKKLAHPGLTLRKITPDLIKKVLAGPCGIEVDTPERAQELWNEMAQETGLVLQDSSDTLRHRPELRRQMIHLLRKTKPDQVRAIHQAAIAYYEESYRASPTLSARAEQFYHMLCLGLRETSLNQVWSPALEPFLLSAREDLPPEALRYLAVRSGGPFESPGSLDATLTGMDLIGWEHTTAQRLQELMRQDRYEEVDKELRLHPQRSPASPLYLIQSQVLYRLGRPAEARTVLEQALQSWPEEGGETRKIDLQSLLIRVLLDLDDRHNARTVLQQASVLLEKPVRVDQRLLLSVLEFLVESGGPDQEVARIKLCVLVDNWKDSELREAPLVARWAAAELLGDEFRDGAARIIRAVGIGPIDPLLRERLVEAFVSWEVASWEGSKRPAGTRAIGVGFMAGARGDGHEEGQHKAFWRRWLTATPPTEIGDKLAAMIVQFPVEPSVQSVLREVLGGRGDVTERRIAEAFTAEEKMSTGEILSQACDLILSAYTRQDLEMLMAFTMDVRLSEIVSDSSSLRGTVFELVTWAERRGQLLDLLNAVRTGRPHRDDIASFVARAEANLNE
jgi:hypothetical protein